MKQATERREVFQVRAGGVWLRGTHHRANESALPAKRVGVLFLNPGFLPRAQPSPVYWADLFAQNGYSSFRVDLPGMGDSEGEVPAKMLDFVNTGGYGPIVAEIVKDLVKRYELCGMVIMGLCAGAVTALFTAAMSPACCGVVMMDPYFFLPQQRTKMREGLGRWAVWSRAGALTSRVYDRLRYIKLMLRGNQLPSNANLPLLRCWRRLGTADVPVLILKAPTARAPGMKPRVGEFDYLEYLQDLSGHSGHMTVEFIEGTNHSFADKVGRTAVGLLTQAWLDASVLPTIRRKLAADHGHPITMCAEQAH